MQILRQIVSWHFLPRFIMYECEKLPLGLAPPTIKILPFPPSSDGMKVQVWPTLTPGAAPPGIKEYLLIRKQLKRSADCNTGANQSSNLTHHIPFLGSFRGSSTGRNSMAVKDVSSPGVIVLAHFSGDGSIRLWSGYPVWYQTACSLPALVNIIVDLTQC